MASTTRTTSAPRKDEQTAPRRATAVAKDEKHQSEKAWRHRDLLDVDVLSAEEIETVMETADAMQEILSRQIPKAPTLRGRTVATIFYEASTRTRASFEWAVKALSGDVVNLAASTSSITKGESLIDTVRTLQSMGAGAIVLRHPESGAAAVAARHADVPVINAGDGRHAHPTQALLDLYTMRAHWRGHERDSIRGRKVAVIGDVLHSRVARSNAWALTAMGADVVFCGPPTLAPDEMTEGFHHAGRTVTVVNDVDSALDGADAVIVLRLQSERQVQGLLPSVRSYVRGYQIDAERLAGAKPDVLLMHPGPINEGVEVTPEVAAGPRSVVQEQVQHGIAVRMAILYLTMTGQSEGGPAA